MGLGNQEIMEILEKAWINKGKEVGIKEVVEWVELLSQLTSETKDGYMLIPEGNWEAYKKEKGL